jgi:hypothetical protein
LAAPSPPNATVAVTCAPLVTSLTSVRSNQAGEPCETPRTHSTTFVTLPTDYTLRFYANGVQMKSATGINWGRIVRCCSRKRGRPILSWLVT